MHIGVNRVFKREGFKMTLSGSSFWADLLDDAGVPLI